MPKAVKPRLVKAVTEMDKWIDEELAQKVASRVAVGLYWHSIVLSR